MVVQQQFDPLEFVQVAEYLADGETSEANLRTAAGRLYYATFLAAREVLNVQGRSRLHGRVIGESRRYDRHASRQLEMLMDLRSIADYDLEVQDLLRRDWQRNYQLARRLATAILERLS